jgi:hypothetical protein
MISAYNFAPGRRGASTQIVIEGFAACAGIAITVVPAIANAPAIAISEYFFFKVSPFMSLAPAPSCRSDQLREYYGCKYYFV